jgi:20S proteasome subunit alpha 7
MSSTGAGYDQDTLTYSPDGKIYQIEYAQKAVDSSGTALAVKCKDGVVLAVEKLVQSKMLEERSGRRLASADKHIGVAIAGSLPDGRQLVGRAQDEARAYRQNFDESISPQELADRMGAFLHVYTCYWYLRPFGSSIIIAGYDEESGEAQVFAADPSGLSLKYHGIAAGKGTRSAKTEIEKGKFHDLTCREALAEVAKIIHTVHDKNKDKPLQLEMSWISEETGWVHKEVAKADIAAAEEAALAAIKAAEDDESDDDDDA